ncbi:BA75_05093T0 [Komagataella pastoris]|uniref:BA75_05093T0 n=1 Tax=Komagataella pastoris TaxID=4922 RepID=A0A1B2JHK3_PICPA|nr:BA75_05093T0 [Komagataella pastoris]
MSEGASPSEQLIDAARRNNVDLLESIISDNKDGITQLINTSQDVMGNKPLHLAATYGAFEVLDILLDQEGVELDSKNRLDENTPLHLAVKYSEEEPEHGTFIVEELIAAGADVTATNKNGDKPVDLVVNNPELTQILLNAEYASNVVTVDEDEDAGPASDSD